MISCIAGPMGAAVGQEQPADIEAGEVPRHALAHAGRQETGDDQMRIGLRPQRHLPESLQIDESWAKAPRGYARRPNPAGPGRL